MGGQMVFKAMDFGSATCRQKLEEGQGENPGFSSIEQPSTGVGAGKGNRKGREEKLYDVFKDRKGKIQEKRCTLSGLKVSHESSDLQAKKWPLGLILFLVTAHFFKDSAQGEVGMEPDGSVPRRGGKAERKHFAMTGSREIDSWK